MGAFVQVADPVAHCCQPYTTRACSRLDEPLWSRPSASPDELTNHVVTPKAELLDMINSELRAEKGFCKTHRPVQLVHLDPSERKMREASLTRSVRGAHGLVGY